MRSQFVTKRIDQMAEGDRHPPTTGGRRVLRRGSPDARIRGLGKTVELVHPFIVGDLAEQIGD
jgi:hypothetical protein